jgi:hypothetical protein
MDDIKTWLQSPAKDYSEGVLLFEKYHKNRMLARYFRNGRAATHAKKLAYELKKLTGVSLTVLFAQNAEPETPASTAIALFPEVIREAKNTVYELFTTLSIMHRQLFELGESNDDDVVKQRKAILEQRLPLIRRYEQIYLPKAQYFNTGVIPVELPLLLGEQAQSPIPAQNSNANDLQTLSGVELMKKKQSLTVAINKIQNRLLYQSLTKGEHPNPMPVSPLRDKLEAKLSKLKEEYKIIVQLIKEKK